MTNITLKTLDSTSIIIINDLGGVNITNSGVNINSLFSLDQINSSSQLRTYISNGEIIVNNGIRDLSSSDGLKHISIKTEYEITSNNLLRSYSFPDSTNCIWFNYNDNTIYTWDESREKWLSSFRNFVTFSNRGNTSGQYISHSSAISSDVGFLVYRPATIISIWGRASEGNSSKEMYIYDDSEQLSSFTMTNLYYKNDLCDIDVGDSEETYLRLFVDSSGQSIKSPVVQLEIAWRYVPS